MKKTIYTIMTIISSMTMFSCQTPEEKMIQSAETILKEDLLDPKTYERITAKIDTFKRSDYIQNRILADSLIMGFYVKQVNNSLDIARIWTGSSSYYGQSKWDEAMKEAKTFLDSAKSREKQMELNKQEYTKVVGTDKDTTLHYKVNIRFYAVNKGGDRAIGEKYVVVNKKGTALCVQMEE